MSPVLLCAFLLAPPDEVESEPAPAVVADDSSAESEALTPAPAPAPVTQATDASVLPPQGRSHARKDNKPKRKGGQAEVMIGAAACVPGKGDDCNDETFGLGSTKPSFGMALNIGWRAHPAFFIGAGYGIGWFNSTWEGSTFYALAPYRTAYDQGVFGILRTYIPIWRIDIGFEIAPGWTRQTFVYTGRRYSQGFALRPGLSLDIWVSRRLFVGAKLDFIFNFHSEICHKSSTTHECRDFRYSSDTRVHQLMGGVQVGGSF
jgi:hypothetical protein